MLLAVLNGDFNEFSIFLFLGSGKDERGIGGSILRFVLVYGCEVAGIANDDLQR